MGILLYTLLSESKMEDNSPILYNLPSWLEENEKHFVPPVCNKMMFQSGQMKAFYVGGPNTRDDYHIDVGEELFYMVKGDMNLKVVEQGQFRDVPIKEGQLFLLPGRIAHSPQRQAETVGMVLERARDEAEKDGLRYYVKKNGEPTHEILYEEWFHCVDLGSQLAPIIKRYFSSEQYKTGRPIPGTTSDEPPVTLDSATKLIDPIDLESWVQDHQDEIDSDGRVKVFPGDFQFQVYVYGKGHTSDRCSTAETFIWQLNGYSTINIAGTDYGLSQYDIILVPQGQEFVVKQDAGARCLVAYQDPTLKKEI